MMINRSRIKGLIFVILFSFSTALFFMLIGQAWAGGITSSWGETIVRGSIDSINVERTLIDGD